MRSLPVSKGCAASRLRKFSAISIACGKVRSLQQERELVAAEPPDQGLGQECGPRAAADRLVAGLMPVGVVDVLEIVDIENDRRQASIRQGHARASLRRLLEEAAPIAQTGQGIDGGEPDQFALHGENPLCGPQPRIKLLGQRRLADEIVGARVRAPRSGCADRIGSTSSGHRSAGGRSLSGASPSKARHRRCV